MKKQFHSTMGLKISVITHLSDDVTQTLCKILLLSKSSFKVGYFFSPSTVQAHELCVTYYSSISQ